MLVKKYKTIKSTPYEVENRVLAFYKDETEIDEKQYNEYIKTVPKPKEEQIDYGEAVDGKIRERYSISEEFAILRQKEEKPEEYSAYYAYCEECKAKIKTMIAESNSEAETPDNVEVIK